MSEVISVRQGDILLVKVPKENLVVNSDKSWSIQGNANWNPSGLRAAWLKESPEVVNIVELGEATGHQHRIEGDVEKTYERWGDAILWVIGKGGADLMHTDEDLNPIDPEDHGPIHLDEGAWLRVPQMQGNNSRVRD